MTSSRVAPDQRGGRGIPVVRTLQVMLQQQEPATSAELVSAVDEALPPDDTYPCMNPHCDGDRPCSWPTGAGRPQRFCSRRCRQQFERNRARLLWEIRFLYERLEDPEIVGLARKQLTRHLAKRRWALERFPLSERDQSALVSSPR